MVTFPTIVRYHLLFPQLILGVCMTYDQINMARTYDSENVVAQGEFSMLDVMLRHDR